MALDYEERDLESVMEIASRILNREDLLAEDDLYEAGLTSLMVLPMMAELESTFQLSFSDGEFLDARTPLALAQMVHHLRS